MTTSQQMEWVSKLGEIQQTIDQVGELKRRDRWVRHTEAAEAQRIRIDRAEATLQILGELNLNMRSKMEKGGARVDLGRQMQFMRRMLDAEQQKEQPAQVMRQEIPEDSGHKQEQGQKDINWGKEDVKARQASRRLKLLMRRLWEDERQRERAERHLRNLISQVQDYKQERGEHDAVQQREDTTIKSSDQKLEKTHKRQKQEWKNRANEQSSVARQTAQQRAANSEEETAEIDSSGYHSGSDRDFPPKNGVTPKLPSEVAQCL